MRHIWRGPSLLVVEHDGSAGEHPLTGYYFRQTRFLKTLRLLVRGESPHVCSNAEIAPNQLELTYMYPEVERGGGGGSGSGRIGDRNGVLYRNLDLRSSYSIRPASFAVTVQLTNRWQNDLDLELAWLLSADYASIDAAQFDAVPAPRVDMHANAAGVTFQYLHPELSFETRIRGEGAAWHFDQGMLKATVTLPRQRTVQVGLVVRAFDPLDPIDEEGEARREARLSGWEQRLPRIHDNGESPFVEYTSRAMLDLGGLSLMEGPEDEWLTPAAGAPLYLAMWGRDALTAAWQAGMIDGGDLLTDVLARTARLQGTREDPERDEEPGRIINQSKLDPESRLGHSPFARYYADVASPFMFLLGLGYHYALTGDKRHLRKHWGAAQRVLEWADRYGDRDGDGYIEYLTKSSSGPTHQGWKDSENAVVDEFGEMVDAPIAACEIQGYWHASLQFMAVMAFAMGERQQARDLWRQASELRERFNRDFWLEDEGFVAFGLGPDKRPIRSITSNAGQCLPTGIISRENATRVVRRLFEPDLFSGWGIRTLSTQNPAYNPLDYHLGAVWPVENATILFGLRRYGFNDRATELTRSLYDLARMWPGGRIPECVGGYPRSDGGHPGAYPQANSVQAWNQSTWALLVQSLLGIVPYAPLHLLMVDPILPAWLPELTIKGLRVGEARVTLRCWRDDDGDSHHEVVEKHGNVHVVRQPWIESVSASLWDRLTAVKDTVFS